MADDLDLTRPLFSMTSAAESGVEYHWHRNGVTEIRGFNRVDGTKVVTWRIIRKWNEAEGDWDTLRDDTSG